MPIHPDHRRRSARSPADYLAVMSRAAFQAGLSWAAIDRQWPQLCEAFDGFDARKVARYGAADVKRIMAYPGIVHSEAKIRGTVHNAKTLLALESEFGSVRRYLRSHAAYPVLAADLKRRFKYLGNIGAYYFLYRVGEPVPTFARWIKTVEGDHPRIREMVGRHA